MSGDVLITVDAVKKELHIEAPYDAEFIAELKKRIPGRDRRWDPDAKIWVCHKMFLRQIQELCEEYYDSVDVDERTVAPVPIVLKVTPDLATIAYANIIRHLTDNALEQIVTLALRDRAQGHDTSSTEVIKDAWQQVKAWRASRETTG